MVAVTDHAVSRFRRRVERGADQGRAVAELRRLAAGALWFWAGDGQRIAAAGAVRIVLRRSDRGWVAVTCWILKGRRGRRRKST
jgi:hypothetical protein